MTRHDGYQPFGYAWPTTRVARPAWQKVFRPLDLEDQRRVEENGNILEND